MKMHLILLGSALLLSACAGAQSVPQEVPDEQETTSDQHKEQTLYKKSFFDGEIPSTWSHVMLGDIGPMPYHDGGWIEEGFIRYSFAQSMVAYGDTNWNQVDIAFLEGPDLERWVTHLKSAPDFNEFLKGWEQVMIDGQTVDVAIFSTEPDGSVSKGGTGGRMYFIPAISEAGYGLVFLKQALGDADFEAGFQHFIDTMDLDAFGV